MNGISQILIGIPKWELMVLKAFSNKKSPGIVNIYHVPFGSMYKKNKLPKYNRRD